MQQQQISSGFIPFRSAGEIRNGSGQRIVFQAQTANQRIRQTLPDEEAITASTLISDLIL